MTAIAELDGTTWSGTCELWLDPLGNDAIRSECAIRVEADAVRYTWSHEGKSHEGSLRLSGDFVDFTDTWHQPEPMRCRRLREVGGLFQAQGSYGPDADWGWRVSVCLRTPSGELVVQMTNITPWGEEGRAVRMVGSRR